MDILITIDIIGTITLHFQLVFPSDIIIAHFTGIPGIGVTLLTHGIHAGLHIMPVIILIIIMAVTTVGIIMDIMEYTTEAANTIKPGQEVIIL